MIALALVLVTMMITISIMTMITFALASLAASASAAIALCSCTGSRTSLLVMWTMIILIMVKMVMKMTKMMTTQVLRMISSHFDPLDLHPPRIGGIIKGRLHPVSDLLSENSPIHFVILDPSFFIHFFAILSILPHNHHYIHQAHAGLWHDRRVVTSPEEKIPNIPLFRNSRAWKGWDCQAVTSPGE